MVLKFKHLWELTQKLRAPGGCPWDREQSLESMMPRVLEESKELEEALANQDWENMEEEMGDLLLCLVMMSQIAGEQKKFTMATILEKVSQKIIRRHTWVFGKDKAETPEQALALWKRNKKRARLPEAP